MRRGETKTVSNMTLTEQDKEEHRRAGRCPTCNIQTDNIYKINGKPFKMPITVEGKVDNGVCLSCNPPKNSEDILRQEADAQQTSPSKSINKCKQKPPSSAVKPSFRSDADAIEYYKRMREEKLAAAKDGSSTGDMKTCVEQPATAATAAGAVDKEQTADDNSNHKPIEEAMGNDRNTTSGRELKIKVYTSANSKQSSPVTLNLDPCTPPHSASDKKPSATKSSQGFDSLEEAKQFIKEKAALEKKEKKRKKQTPARTSKRSRPQQRPERKSGRSKPHKIEEGTQMELNRIMKKNNALSESIRQSILVAAVISRKNNKLSGSNESFLASNGKLYPDLRSNFGKYANMKQCAVCKQRVQGAYYCRLKHCHLEVTDYDGGNSAEGLKELFRKSVAELEQIQRYYVGDYDEEGVDDSTAANLAAADHGKDWSLDQLNEDLIFHVASYIPTLGDLSTFSKTCKRAHRLFTSPAQSERLLRGVYTNRYCERSSQGLYDFNRTWKERWTMMHSLKNSLKHASELPKPSRNQLRETVGVMSENDEVDAIFYDNPDRGDPEQDYCNGYFGMHMLHLPPPPNAHESWQPPVLLHGDFHGVRIFDSLQRVIYRDEDESPSPRFVALDGMDGGQVLSIIHCDDIQAGSPCCFVGYASGRVAAVRFCIRLS